MTITMPPLRQTPSPNFSSRNGAAIRLIVVHMQEGTYEGSIAWFAMSKSQVSSHLLMKADGSEWAQMVPLTAKAWHACNTNPYSIGIEGEGFTAKGFSDVWANSMALGVAWLLHAYGLPCRWAEGGQGSGFCSHHDLGAMGGGHVDIGPCGGPDWQRFAVAVGKAYAALDGAPLPAWALHGLPNPLAATAAPAVTPVPSHGGAARTDDPPQSPNLAFDLTTAAGVQGALHALGYRLTVDGDYGAETKAAVRKFQAHCGGLAVDGIAGPATQASLVKELAKVGAHA